MRGGAGAGRWDEDKGVLLCAVPEEMVEGTPNKQDRAENPGSERAGESRSLRPRVHGKYVITCFCLPIHTFHQELVLKIYHVQSGYIRLLAEFVDILYGEQADPLLILLK